MLTTGTIIGGRYHLISHLGGGGFGQTYLAEDRHLPGNPQCVVKQLKPKATHDTVILQLARRLFNREAEALYKLGIHDQIPRLFAHFEEGEEFYLVQEFVEGADLKQDLSGGRKWQEPQVVEFLEEVLKILEFVHQQNVIHRDIKPSNLMRRQADNKIVLLDFGAVKQIDTQIENLDNQTGFTVSIGSPGYMPNEQVAGDPCYSSDIYALGMIGIRALTGLHPKRIPKDPHTSEVVWLDQAQVSPKLAEILSRMVRYDFRQRYQSATETLQALQELKPSPSPSEVSADQLGELSETLQDLQRQTVQIVQNVSHTMKLKLDRTSELAGNAIGPKPGYRIASALQKHRHWVLGASIAALVGSGATSVYVYWLAQQPKPMIFAASQLADVPTLLPPLPDVAVSDIEELIKLGNTFEKLEQYPEALNFYQQAVQAMPTDPRGWQGQCKALGVLKRYPEALKACDRTLKVSPTNAGVWQQKGWTLEQLSRSEEAKLAYKKAAQFRLKSPSGIE